jgi:hypothetical protein
MGQGGLCGYQLSIRDVMAGRKQIQSLLDEVTGLVNSLFYVHF